MKNLPQHTPKSTSWEKILQQQDFEAQLEKVSLDLPNYAPKANAWEGIASQLDTEKPIFSIWQKLAAAMVFLVVSLFTWVLLNQNTESAPEPNLITQTQEISIPISIEKPISEGKESSKENVKPTILEKENKRTKLNKTLTEVETPFIALPTIVTPQKNIDPTYNPKQFTASSENKSLHEVDISWGKGRSKVKVKTAFGKPVEELQPNQKSQMASSKAIQIRFKN
ncbi:hypothetical protein [Algoriphagus sp. PAP.12]|uniref:hypothetical protein n=1 Tax=Algoriphagus sp. PAP.12 TaxID=2996678 RepID=UPI00227C71D4|nr:hypothetical protein [Algoriphagus sp. PAP.12]